MRVIDSAIKLRPFQKKFIKGAFRKNVDTGVLSLPRGNGKSWLAAHLVARSLTPGDPMYTAGAEVVLLAASLEQARIVYNFVREALESTAEDYSWLDSSTRIGIKHNLSRTRLRVLSSKAKSAFGLVRVPLLIADEPGAWEVTGGTLMSDAIFTAMGKPNSALRAIFIGTLAPSTAGWWSELVSNGTQGTVYVQSLRGNVDRWDKWQEIKRCNPLTSISAPFRAKLIAERDAARRDTRLKGRYLSYRLNVPTGDESSMLLTIDDYKQLAARSVPPRIGRPLCSVDLGGSRAWSAALVIYRNGRIECRALAPGIPNLEAQEARDRVPRGTYQVLKDQGVLIQADGLRVPPAAMLVSLITSTWGKPASLICDRFRLDELRDARVPCRVVPRVTRWSEASFDIRALRSKVKDGPFTVAECSRSLLEASLAVATVRSDDQGSVRLIKRTSNNESRDDVAAALCLAAGAFVRSVQPLPSAGKTLHMVV